MPGHYYYEFTTGEIDTLGFVFVYIIKSGTTREFTKEVEIVENISLINTIDTVVDAIKTITDNLPNSGALIDIDTGINNIEAKLPTNYIMGSSVQSDKDDEIDDIKAKTDNLPTDPADQSQVESAISTTESNIRGVDSDTLKTISDQLDVVQTDLDAPNQYKADVSALATEVNATSNKNEIITEIDANETKLDTIDTIVDAIKLKTDNLPDNTNTLLLRIVGLLKENAVFEFTFTNSNNTAGKMYLYNSKANAETHDKSTGLLAEYTISCTYDSNKPQEMIVVKE